MSVAARARRSRRGTRRYLPIVLGLAFLASALGTLHGHQRAAEPLGPLPAHSVLAAPADRGVDHLAPAAEAGIDRSGTAPVPAMVRRADDPQRLTQAAPPMAAPAPAALAGRVPAPGAPRAPPRPGH